jgi:hypothetical protein
VSYFEKEGAFRHLDELLFFMYKQEIIEKKLLINYSATDHGGWRR